MRLALRAILVLALAGSACAPRRATPEPARTREAPTRAASPRVAEWRAALEGQEVEGRRVGAGGSMSDFYRLGTRVLATATAEDVDALLDDPNPTVRSMGALALARTRPDEARRRLPELACDAGPIILREEGCVGFPSNVGSFVMELVGNPGVLEGGDGWILEDADAQGYPRRIEQAFPALLELPQRVAIAFDVAARDACAASRESGAMRVLGTRLEDDEPPLTWEQLAALSDLPGPARVKAVARYRTYQGRQTSASLAFLRSVVARRDLEPDVRLAAASGLASIGDRHDLARLAALVPYFDAVTVDRAGTMLHERLSRRLAFDAEFDSGALHTWSEMEGTADVAIRAFERAPVASLDEILSRGLLGYGDRTRDVHAALETTLRRFLREADRGFHPWDVESDLGYRLRWLTEGLRLTNFEVADREALIAELRAASVEVLPR